MRAAGNNFPRDPPHRTKLPRACGTATRAPRCCRGFKPARFSFCVNRALAAALKASDEDPQVTIVPRDIDVDGRRTTPKAEADVRLGSATLSVKRQAQRR